MTTYHGRLTPCPQCGPCPDCGGPACPVDSPPPCEHHDVRCWDCWQVCWACEEEVCWL